VPTLTTQTMAMAARQRTCFICGGAVGLHVLLTRAGAGAEIDCGSPGCRMLRLRSQYVGPAGMKVIIAVHRKQRRDQLWLAERNSRETLENAAIRQAANQQEPLPAQEYPLVVIPTAPTILLELPQDRLQRYEEHLAAVIAEAVAQEPTTGDTSNPIMQGDPIVADAETAMETSDAPTNEAETVAPPTPPDPPLAQQICTLCRGGCCTSGGEHAYIDAATIRRFMRMNPSIPVARIAESYLELLGDRTIAGSCVNHTSSGCSLPRGMRSDTCNAYYCKALRDWQARCSPDENPRGAFVIQREHDNWHQDRVGVPHEVVRVHVLTEAGTRMLQPHGSVVERAVPQNPAQVQCAEKYAAAPRSQGGCAPQQLTSARSQRRSRE
jgi:hypothetical protein